MHLRQWTYFRVTGQLGERTVTGTGRVPFVFATARSNRPWLRLKLGADLTVTDSGRDARLIDGEGVVVGRYPRGSFFRGLARPWMGLHAMDTVRRDAAEQQVPFETDLTPDGDKAIITITSTNTRLVYTVDLANDLIETITLFAHDVQVGELRFEYLQDVEGVGAEFAEPRSRSTRTAQAESQGMLWLIRLANDELGR
jgi:hypothetical protein